MRWPRRSTHIRDDVRAALRLEAGERVLAAARRADGEWLVATDRGLVTDDLRLDWSSITRAQWYDEESVLTLVSLDDDGIAHERSFHLADPGLLPETVHERVTATILLSRRLALPRGRAARVVARRQPGSDEILWQVVPGPDVDLSDPDTRARVDEVLHRLAMELGE